MSAMQSQWSGLAPIEELIRLLDEFGRPTVGPRDRVQIAALRAQILKAADRCGTQSLLRAAQTLDDPILQSLLLTLAAQYKIIQRHLWALGVQESVSLAPQDAAMISALTATLIKLSNTFYQCLKISSAHRPFRPRA